MHNAEDTDYKQLSEDYAYVIGLLLSKIGPTQINAEEIDLYNMSGLRPFAQMHTESIDLFLLGEDEAQSDTPRKFFE